MMRIPLTKTLYVILIFILTSTLLHAATARSTVLDTAAMVPNDAVLTITLDSIDELKQAFRKTAFYDLAFQDPAMKPFTQQAQEALEKTLKKGLQQLWDKLELSNPPQDLPLPEGRIIVMLFIGTEEVVYEASDSIIDMDESNDVYQGDETVTEGDTFTVNEPTFEIVCLADMGQKLKDAQRIAKAWATGQKTDGFSHKKKRVQGVTMNLLTWEDEYTGAITVNYGFQGPWLIVGTGLDKIESTLRHFKRKSPTSLASLKGFKPMARVLEPAPLFAFINAEPLRVFLKELANDAQGKWKTTNAITQLGFDEVLGLGLSVSPAESAQENYRLRYLMALNGPKTGIPALLNAPPMRYQSLRRTIRPETVFFMSANYDLGVIYDQIATMVRNTLAVDMTFFAQSAMVMTGTESRPPVDLKNDVLDPLSCPITLSWHMDEPYVDANNSKTCLRLATSNSSQLETSLARIHETYLAKNDPDLQRSLLKHTLYLLPATPLRSIFVPFQYDSANDSPTIPPKQMGFTLANNQLVFAEVDELEQAVRNTRQKQPSAPVSPFEPLTRRLPTQAIMYYLQNDQQYNKINWTRMKHIVPTWNAKALDFEDASLDDWEKELLSWIRSIDTEKLPPFEKIAKYFGVSGGAFREHELGLFCEFIMLKGDYHSEGRP